MSDTDDVQAKARDAAAYALGLLKLGATDLERVECILAALAAAGLVIERDWQTIDTAPKDGTPIWIADDFAMRIVVWNGRWLDWKDRTPCLFESTRWRPVPTRPASPSPAAAADQDMPSGRK